MQRKRNSYGALYGWELSYLGVSTSPLASFASSYIQQRIPQMNIAGLKHANGIVKDFVKRDSTITNLRSAKEQRIVSLVIAFSETAYPHQGQQEEVAQEGFIIGIAYGLEKGRIFHTLAWLSRKQQRVSASSLQAEGIAALTSIGYALHVQQVLSEMIGIKLPVNLVLDSLCLRKTLATQATPKDMSTASDIHGLSLDYESGVINKVS